MITLIYAIVVSTLRVPAGLLAAAPPLFWGLALLSAAVLWAALTIQTDVTTRHPRTGAIRYAQ